MSAGRLRPEQAAGRGEVTGYHRRLMMPISRAFVVTVLISAPLVGIAAPPARAERGVGTSVRDLYGLSPDGVQDSADVQAFYGDLDTPSDVAQLRRGVFIGPELQATPAEAAVERPGPSARAGSQTSGGWLRGAVLAALAVFVCWAARRREPGRCAGGVRRRPPRKTPTSAATPTRRPPSAAAVGGRAARPQVFRWPEIEPQPGIFDFSATDRFVLAAARANIEVMPVLFGEPAWASSRPRRFDGSCRVPAARTRRLRGVRARRRRALRPHGHAVGRSADVPRRPIVHYQLWNEPNLGLYWGGRIDPTGFAQLVGAATSAIRAVDPSA